MTSAVPSSKLRIYALIDRLIDGKKTAMAQGNAEAAGPESLPSFVGTWSLLWTDDDKTRASPFFWAFRKAFGETSVPGADALGTNNLASAVFKITDAIPASLKQIGSAKQYVKACGKLVSQIEILSPIGSSFMTTTSRWKSLGAGKGEDGDEVELRVEKTQVLGSTLQKLLSVPSSNILVARGFPSGAALELASPGSSTVGLTNLYLDATLRVSRNDFDQVFVFERVLDGGEPVGL